MWFHFVDPGNTSVLSVTNSLSFAIGDDGGDTDSWTIRAFDLSNNIIDTQSLSGASHQTYTLVMAGIHRIFIDNTTGTTAGFGVDNISFNTPASVSVAGPATLALLGVGVAGIGLRRRNRERRG